MKKMVIGIVFGSLLFTLACVKGNKCPDVKVVNSSAGDPIMAVVDGESITQSAIDKELSGRDKGAIIKAKSELYDAQMEVVEEFVFNKLVQTEAKKNNITTEEYLKKEVESKVKKPSNKEIEDFYNTVKTQYERNGKTPPPLNDAVKEQINQQLTMKATIERKQALSKHLLQIHNVTYGLEQPRIQVANGSHPSKGAKDGKITIVEFSDFQCPFCKKGAETMKQVMQKYGSKVTYYFRDFPLSFHDHAKVAANAARCAGDQGKFWEFHDKLFADQSKLSDDDLIALGKSMKFDMAKFEPCIKNHSFATEVEADMRDGENAGVSGTPAYFINGIFLSGALPMEKFEAVINAELKK